MKATTLNQVVAITFMAIYGHGNLVLASEPNSLDESIHALQAEWARIYYQIPDHELQEDAIDILADQAHVLTAEFPNRAETLIWEGIILSTSASINGGISALGKVKKARSLFEAALEIDDQALQGSAYTSLGSLYYQVPGWPIAFGDNDKAEKLLKKALTINPTGIDPNYFYGDFLVEEGRTDEARSHFQKALSAPDRPGRSLADKGRRQEIKAAVEELD